MTWLMSALTILTLWLAGSKNPWAWRIGLFNQLLWWHFIFATNAWGLAPMSIAIAFVYTRNLILWHRAPSPNRQIARAEASP